MPKPKLAPPAAVSNKPGSDSKTKPASSAIFPSNFQYLDSHCVPSLGLSKPEAALFCTPFPAGISYNTNKLRSQKLTAVKAINDAAHPANGQHGLFAAKTIPPRTVLIQYLGQVHTDEESDPTSDYDLRVHADEVLLGIDATRMGNEARFVNDYRGVAERPNVSFEELESTANGKKIKGLFFVSMTREIRKGTELVTSYGKGFWKSRAEEAETDAAESEVP